MFGGFGSIDRLTSGGIRRRGYLWPRSTSGSATRRAAPRPCWRSLWCCTYCAI